MHDKSREPSHDKCTTGFIPKGSAGKKGRSSTLYDEFRQLPAEDIRQSDSPVLAPRVASPQAAIVTLDSIQQSIQGGDTFLIYNASHKEAFQKDLVVRAAAHPLFQASGAHSMG